MKSSSLSEAFSNLNYEDKIIPQTLHPNPIAEKSNNNSYVFVMLQEATQVDSVPGGRLNDSRYPWVWVAETQPSAFRWCLPSLFSACIMWFANHWPARPLTQPPPSCRCRLPKAFGAVLPSCLGLLGRDTILQPHPMSPHAPSSPGRCK